MVKMLDATKIPINCREPIWYGDVRSKSIPISYLKDKLNHILRFELNLSLLAW